MKVCYGWKARTIERLPWSAARVKPDICHHAVPPAPANMIFPGRLFVGQSTSLPDFARMRNSAMDGKLGLLNDYHGVQLVLSQISIIMLSLLL